MPTFRFFSNFLGFCLLNNSRVDLLDNQSSEVPMTPAFRQANGELLPTFLSTVSKLWNSFAAHPPFQHLIRSEVPSMTDNSVIERH